MPVTSHDDKMRQLKFKAAQQLCNKTQSMNKSCSISKHVTQSDRMIIHAGKPLVVPLKKE